MDMYNIDIGSAYEMLFKQYPDVLGVKEVSTMLNICTKKVYHLIKDGSIPTIPLGRVHKIAKVNVIIYLMKHIAAPV